MNADLTQHALDVLAKPGIDVVWPERLAESEEIAPGIVLDYDANDRVVGIEMLNLSKRAPKSETDNVLFTCVQHLTNLETAVREETKPYGV